jgi:hypothetical protein
VVVEDGDPRVLPVRVREIRIGLVQCVPEPVAAQVDGLGDRLGVALSDQRGRAVAVGAVAVLVDVIPDVQDEVEVVAVAECPVGTEVAAGVVAARHQRQAQRVDLVRFVRSGLRTPDRAGLAVCPETVVVPGVGP